MLICIGRSLMMKDAGRFRGKAVVLLDDAEQLRWVRGIQIKVGKKFFTLFFSMQTQLQSEFPLGFFVLIACWVIGVVSLVARLHPCLCYAIQVT